MLFRQDRPQSLQLCFVNCNTKKGVAVIPDASFDSTLVVVDLGEIWRSKSSSFSLITLSVFTLGSTPPKRGCCCLASESATVSCGLCAHKSRTTWDTPRPSLTQLPFELRRGDITLRSLVPTGSVRRSCGLDFSLLRGNRAFSFLL